MRTLITSKFKCFSVGVDWPHNSIEIIPEMTLFLFMCTLFEFICDSGRLMGYFVIWEFKIKSMCCSIKFLRREGVPANIDHRHIFGKMHKWHTDWKKGDRI